MLRPLLTLLLLLNYLLVVCASVAERPIPLVARPYHYAHRADCQVRNAWRGGVCFEDCNGVQYHVHKGHKPVPLQQVLTSLKGLDLHCLPATAVVSAVRFFGPAGRLLAGRETGVPSGVRGKIYLPPRRG